MQPRKSPTDRQLDRIVQRWIAESARRVLERRTALGLKRSQVALRARTTIPTIHRIEHGAIVPREQLKIAIAHALECQPGDLWPAITIDEVAA